MSQDLDELFPSLLQSLPLHQLEVQWQIFSFILQTSWQEDFNLRIISFQALQTQATEGFKSMVPGFKE
jgi:hypothetical protein